MLRPALAATVALTLAAATPAFAQTADTVLFNGKVVTVDREFSVREAIAIADGRVLATGTSAAMKKLAGNRAKMIDLGGRTVIPGLTDGHIHGIRAALTFGSEVNWIGVPTLKEALAKIRKPRRPKPPDPGSSSPAAGPRSNSPRNAARRRRRSRRPRQTIPSTSSISMIGPCSRPRPWSSSASMTMPT